MPKHIKTLAKVIPRNQSRRWRNTRRCTSTTQEIYYKEENITYNSGDVAENAVETATATLATLNIATEDRLPKGAGFPYGTRRATRAQKILAQKVEPGPILSAETSRKASEAQSLAEFLALIQLMSHCQPLPLKARVEDSFGLLQRASAAEEPEDEYLEMESISSALNAIVPPPCECPPLSPTSSTSSLESEEEYFVITSSGQLIPMEEHEKLYRLERDLRRMTIKEASARTMSGYSAHD